MKWIVLSVLWLMLSLSGVAAESPLRVAIQPLGPVSIEVITAVKTGIRALYTVEVEVLPVRSLPKSAYYLPRDRYKAEDLVETLELEIPPRFHKVVALTAHDISVTTDEGNDWGIMGLGQLGGRACVVSTFRLQKDKPTEIRFLARLVKVVNHELGHTFGLDHCPAARCLMRDARGKVATVDGEWVAPCAGCAGRLPMAK